MKDLLAETQRQRSRYCWTTYSASIQLAFQEINTRRRRPLFALSHLLVSSRPVCFMSCRLGWAALWPLWLLCQRKKHRAWREKRSFITSKHIISQSARNRFITPHVYVAEHKKFPKLLPHPSSSSHYPLSAIWWERCHQTQSFQQPSSTVGLHLMFQHLQHRRDNETASWLTCINVVLLFNNPRFCVTFSKTELIQHDACVKWSSETHALCVKCINV